MKLVDDVPVASGIYKITCTANKKIYIGSAVNLRKRQQQHWSDFCNNKHCNLHMQRAWNKYGEQVFIFEVLEFVLPMSLTAREQYWFKKLKPFGRKGFNILLEAGSNLGMKHTLEAREKIKQAQNTPEVRERNRLAQIGNKHALGNKLSREHCEIIKQSQIGNKNHLGRKDSLETKERKSQSHMGNKSHLGQECPLEVREKIRQTSKDRPKSLKTRERMKQAWVKRKEKMGAA